MKFAHFADTHLGYRQYGLHEREEDFYYVFNEIVDKIIEERVDFILHSGDLFDSARPSPNTLIVFQNALKKIVDAGIPFYAIHGNHDIVMRKGAIPPQALFTNYGLKLIGSKNPFFIHNDIFIGGTPYLSRIYKGKLLDDLKSLSTKANDYKKSILMLHQGIDKYLPFEYELEMANLPENFNYYACGHIQKRITEEFGDGILSYSGSTEVYRTTELGSYLRDGKGFNLVDLDGDIPTVETINVKPRREFLVEHIDYSNFDYQLKSLETKIKQLSNKPILNVSIENGKYNNSDVFEKLNNVLKDITLSFRPNFSSFTSDNQEIFINNDSLNPKELLKERLEGFGNEDISNLAVDLLDAFSKDKQEEANLIAKKFYNGYFGLN
ncbi:MAG: DNA repair exonuclease [Methanobrevibacter sp.]|jgi:DNA repair exonuclease SbcCD nuclease subunit|nr:DNA repair exonuclease [Candidatus Methanoflexus mossambicus]